jgi:hypothetical protein
MRLAERLEDWRTEVKLEGGRAGGYTCPPRWDNDSGGKQRAVHESAASQFPAGLGEEEGPSSVAGF